MNKFAYVFLFHLFFVVNVLADWGFYWSDRSWIGINFDGVNTSYKLFDGGTVSGPGFFDGSLLGGFTSQSQTLAISFWDIKTWKNGGSDVQQAQLYYRIYEQGQTPGSFIQVVGGWLQDYGSGNQKWGKASSTSINISGLLPGKTWVLELYIQVYGTLPDEWKHDSNGGLNYKATFTTDGAFPIELSSFSFSILNNSVNLLWETSTEVNNYGFEIERKQKPNNENHIWAKIGFVKGSGNSNSPKSYSFTDQKVQEGKYVYRLKQIDSDGNFSYSKEIEVEVTYQPSEFALHQNFPNPFNPKTIISWQSPVGSHQTLKVYDVLGDEIASLVDEYKPAGSYEIEFSIKGTLSSGVYFYRLQIGDFIQTNKMILAQ